MRFIELESVKHRLQVGVPLPFNVRQSDHTLLLARGQVLVGVEQLQALFQRGMRSTWPSWKPPHTAC